MNMVIPEEPNSKLLFHKSTEIALPNMEHSLDVLCGASYCILSSLYIGTVRMYCVSRLQAALEKDPSMCW